MQEIIINEFHSYASQAEN